MNQEGILQSWAGRVPLKGELKSINPNNLCTRRLLLTHRQVKGLDCVLDEDETGRARRGAKAISPKAANGPLR
jgi:hypothetical protein